MFFPLVPIVLVRKKMSPDVTSYGALASSCEKDAEWQLALHFLREFQSTNFSSAESVWKNPGELFQHLRSTQMKLGSGTVYCI